MPTLTVDIPAPIATDVLFHFTNGTGYQTTVRDVDGSQIPNPETRAQYAKRMLLEFVKRTAQQQRRNEVVRVASAAAEAADTWPELGGIV